MVKVLVEQTGVEMCVSRKYYEKYKGDGIRFISEVIEEAPVKDIHEMNHQELKGACKAKGLDFKGNAPKDELIRLLEE